MMTALPASLVLDVAWVALGQTAGPAFEVASVKPAKPAANGTWQRSSSGDQGRLTFDNVTLRRLLTSAYKVRDYQISDPAWLDQERYDVAAKIPDNTPKEQVPLMLQALLAERFHLALHHEQKETQMYALTVAKAGIKLKPAVDAYQDFSGGRVFRAGALVQTLNGNMTLETLALVLSDSLGNPVLNTTGMAGPFEMNLEWYPDDRERGGGMVQIGVAGASPAPAQPRDAAAVPSGPSLFTAIQALGLKLEPRRAPLDTLVIDRAKKVPTEN